MCTHCGETHFKARCAILGVENYTPSGFIVRLGAEPHVDEFSNDHPMLGAGSVPMDQDVTDDVDHSSNTVTVGGPEAAGIGGSSDQTQADVVTDAPGADLLDELEAALASSSGEHHNKSTHSPFNHANEAHPADVAIVGSGPCQGTQNSVTPADRLLDELTVYQASTSAEPRRMNDFVQVKEETMDAACNHQAFPARNTQPIRSAPAAIAATIGINPERAAMIATEPVIGHPKQPVGIISGLGPQRSGMNSMPLGRNRQIGSSQPAGTSRFGGAPRSAHEFQLGDSTRSAGARQFNEMSQAYAASQSNRAAESNTARNKFRCTPAHSNSILLRSGALIHRAAHPSQAQSSGKPPVSRSQAESTGHDRQIWENLKQQIRSAVEEAAANNAQLAAKLPNSNVKSALMALRPLILGRGGFSPADFDEFD